MLLIQAIYIIINKYFFERKMELDSSIVIINDTELPPREEGDLPRTRANELRDAMIRIASDLRDDTLHLLTGSDQPENPPMQRLPKAS